MAALHPLTRSVRLELGRLRHRGRAAGMQAYLKSAMPCYGVYLPKIREVCRAAFDAHPLTGALAWRQAIAAVWDQATHVEERFAAIALAGDRRYQGYVSMAILPLYRRMIREGAWWHTVDALAERVSDLLLRHPDRMKPILRAWSVDRDIWLRRVAIIAQIRRRRETDLALLHDVIEPSLESTEFFLRKAIGWALREYAKTDPEHVLRFLQRERRLSSLSRREALKGVAFVRRHGRLL